jgi:hypothetical protein
MQFFIPKLFLSIYALFARPQLEQENEVCSALICCSAKV